MPGMIIGDSDTLGLDLEYEVAGEKVGASFITYCTTQHNTNHSILNGNFGTRYLEMLSAKSYNSMQQHTGMAFAAQYFLYGAAYEIKKEVWRPNSLPTTTFKAPNRNSYAIPFSGHL